MERSRRSSPRDLRNARLSKAPRRGARQERCGCPCRFSGTLPGCWRNLRNHRGSRRLDPRLRSGNPSGCAQRSSPTENSEKPTSARVIFCSGRSLELVGLRGRWLRDRFHGFYPWLLFMGGPSGAVLDGVGFVKNRQAPLTAESCEFCEGSAVRDRRRVFAGVTNYESRIINRELKSFIPPPAARTPSRRSSRDPRWP